MRLVAALLVIATLSCSTVSAGFRGHANLYQLSQRVHEWEQQQQQTSQHLLKTEPRWEYVETNRFTQPLDHFNEQDTRTWQQRYYINTEFEVVGGPIFVYIGGESEVSNRSVVGGEIHANAKLHNATIMSVEHRYYGESVPQLFTNLDTENLNWLTSQQALADLANIITSLMSSRAGWAGRKVFTWGGSYPGALSAWFRVKYPHLTVGSVASSAPVLAKPDFYEYDESVATAIGNTCANKIQQATTAIEALLKINSTETKERFGCDAIENDVSFLYVLADAVAYAVQYSKTINGTAYDGLCEIMETPGDLVENYVTFLKNLLHKKRTTCLDFSTSEEILSNTTIDPENSGRQWYYQSCNEFGYFQTAPIAPRFSLRSRLINVSYHEKLCATVFGRMIKPHTDFTNAYYGGDKTAGSNIIFVNGNIDPWHKLSIIAPLNPYPTEIPVYINGTSHCADLASASDNDPPSLTIARATIRDIISTWLAEERVQACPTYMTVCNGRCVDTENDPHHCGSCGNDITTQSDRYCANGMSQDSSPRSEIGRELIIIGGVCTLIGIVALIVAVRALRRAKQMNESHGLSHEYNAMRA